MCNKSLVIERVKQCYAIAEERFEKSFTLPTILFTKRGRVSGTANSFRNELNFNMVLLNENLEEFVEQTVSHECAHLIDDTVYGSLQTSFNRNGTRKKRSPHGRNWQSVMRVLGVEPNRCHKYDTTNSRQTRKASTTYSYLCTGCDKVLQMGAIRHNKQQTGKASYSHCRGHSLILVK